MINAGKKDRSVIVDILTKAYDHNETINETILQGSIRSYRLRKLMEFSIFVCTEFGKVYLSDNKQSVALVLFPDLRRTTIKTIWWDIQFLFTISGFSRSLKALSREKAVSKTHPAGKIYHLWYLGTNPSEAGKGFGGDLIKELIVDAQSNNRTLCVESRIEENTKWYKKFGFSVYDELIHNGRKWSCMKIEARKLSANS